MSDWTDHFAGFIEYLINNKRGKIDMKNELETRQLKRVFRLFYHPSLVEVKEIEDQENGDRYGVYIIHPLQNATPEEEEKAVFDHVNAYDPTWTFWRDEKDIWGATVWLNKTGNPEDEVEHEYNFETHNFSKVLKKVFEVLSEQFMADIDEMATDYLKYD